MESEKVKLLCGECGISFARSDSLARHNRHIHNATKLEHVACPENDCNFTCARICHLDRHLLDVHGRRLDKECHHFRSVADFEAWKHTIKQTQFFRYVLTGRRARGQCYILRCHRSGNPEPSRATGKRPRRKGTIKIGRTCPSRMKVFESNTGVDVMYVKTHIGHGSENLFPLRRKKLKNELFTEEDASSVDKMVQNWRSSGDGSVVFYKPQGVVDECRPELGEYDYALAIMNRKQQEMLRLYAKNLVCFDMSNAIGPYRLFLGTLMVLDNNGEAFPCAFFVSSRKDRKMYEILFDAICEHTGQLPTQVFLSDGDIFADAWTATMRECGKKFLCSWHVQQNWQKHLNNLSDATVRTNLKRELDSVLKESDIQTFQIKYNTLLHKLGSDPATKPLETHLMQNFTHCIEQWAYCFYVQSGLSAVVGLENLHKRIKKIYFGSKPGKPIGLILNDLHQFTVEKPDEKATNVLRIERMPKMDDVVVRENHMKSLEAAFNFITETTDGNFYVRSFTKELYYAINIYKYDCNCELVCSDCRMCAHRYRCSCFENAEKQNMCKHIHLLGRYLLEAHAEPEHNYANETSTALLMLGINGEVPTIEPEIVVEQSGIVAIQEPVMSVDHEKQNILMLMQEIKDRCLQTHSLGELEAIKNNLRRVLPNLSSTNHLM